MSWIIAIVITGLGTYISRALFILALANQRIPRPVALAMEYVGPSVLAALVITLMVSPQEGVGPGAPELLALAVAVLLAWKFRNHMLTLVAAMVVYWGVRALIPV